MVVRADMASRPKRVCTDRTRERIARILEWENCSENSTLFRSAAAQMEREFEGHAPDSDYASEANASEEASSDDDAMDEDSSDHGPPSSADEADMCSFDDEKNVTGPTGEDGGSVHAPVQ